MSTENCIIVNQCLAAPKRAQYGGGMIGFNQRTNGSTLSSELGVSNDGLHNTTLSILKTVKLEKGNLYTFSAVAFKASNGELVHGGETMAKQGCWSLLKGGIVAEFTGVVEILLMVVVSVYSSKAMEIRVDNVSLQPFTAKEWRSHQDKSIDKVIRINRVVFIAVVYLSLVNLIQVRKKKVSFKVTYANGTAADGALILILQTKSGFPFGCGMNHYIVTDEAYRQWFASRFKVTSFTNEMKWYSTEKTRGVENYTVADAMVNFAEQNGISIRGHNVFWDNRVMQPKWVKDLPPAELMKAATRRLNSVVSRYAGRLIGWDVMNENLHFRFFEDKLGENASSMFYSMAYHLDPSTTLFMNEYNTIENSKDHTATACKYKEELEKILSFPGNAGLKAAIGLEGHFRDPKPNIAFMRSALDILGTMGLPIWLTEVDVGGGPDQCMTLANYDFEPTPVGEVVDKLINEWKSGRRQVRTDSRGMSEILLFHGDYRVKVSHPLINSSMSINFK
ncbi:hypothetical protein Gotur_007021, partial [Gossypium turneri]